VIYESHVSIYKKICFHRDFSAKDANYIYLQLFCYFWLSMNFSLIHFPKTKASILSLSNENYKLYTNENKSI